MLAVSALPEHAIKVEPMMMNNAFFILLIFYGLYSVCKWGNRSRLQK
jgi:hypothetical protein